MGVGVDRVDVTAVRRGSELIPAWGEVACWFFLLPHVSFIPSLSSRRAHGPEKDAVFKREGEVTCLPITGDGLDLRAS